jgi:hypothetical protein
MFRSIHLFEFYKIVFILSDFKNIFERNTFESFSQCNQIFERIKIIFFYTLFKNKSKNYNIKP